ncbi:MULTISPECIES: LysE family transporter [Gordonia]|uniref:LysE family transporter n=1 Tax=Gordonia TaxID=2053 RepID=UPI0022721312|nr:MULTISPECIES: LysE family transporter [Gordonia]
MVGGSVLLLVGAHAIFRAHSTSSRAQSTSSRAQSTSSRAQSTKGHRYLMFVGLTAMNPATLIYFASIAVPAVALPSGGHISGCGAALFVAGVGLGSLLWQAVLAIAGAAAGTRITGSGRRLTIIAGNAVVALLGVSLIAASLH